MVIPDLSRRPPRWTPAGLGPGQPASAVQRPGGSGAQTTNRHPSGPSSLSIGPGTSFWFMLIPRPRHAICLSIPRYHRLVMELPCIHFPDCQIYQYPSHCLRIVTGIFENLQLHVCEQAHRLFDAQPNGRRRRRGVSKRFCVTDANFLQWRALLQSPHHLRCQCHTVQLTYLSVTGPYPLVPPRAPAPCRLSRQPWKLLSHHPPD